MKLSRLLVAAAVVAACPIAAAAQPSIRAGQTVQGRLDSSDPTMEDGSLYDLYVFQGRPGERLVITMRSDDFDTYLSWGTVSGREFSVEDSDDDGGGGTDSRLEVTVGGSGRYAIRANALSEGMSGAYTLSIEGGGAGPAPAPGPGPGPGRGGPGTITAGQTVNGRLDASDPTMDDGSHFDAWTYQGRPGEQIVITLRSDDFDAYLGWGRMVGGEFQVDDNDDDGGGGTDSQITATVGSGGSYTIVANSLGAGETGSYTLSVQSAGGNPRPGAGGTNTIAAGQTVTGRLDSSDNRLDDGSYLDTWTYQGSPGEEITITLTSQDFDTYLAIGRMRGGSFELLGRDDDGGGGTNSMVQVALDASGTYMIHANAFEAGATGTYTLAVERAGGGGRTAASLPTVSPGQTVNGRLDSSDPLATDNSYYDLYTVRGTPGEQVVVTLRSPDFDAYLGWGRLVGGNFTAEENDDDSGGGTDAQMVITIPQSGSYALAANSLRAGETGRYSLTVEGARGAQRQTPSTPSGAATVAAGQSVSGTLNRSDPMLSDSSFYDLYVYRGNPGDRLEITLTSSDFDTYLRWGRVSGGEFELEAYDDDGGGGTNSRVEVTVGGTGVYAIQANAFEAGATGSYNLNVRQLAASQRPVAETPERPSNLQGKWMYSYADVRDTRLRPLGQRMKEGAALETFTELLNQNFPLPRNVAIQMGECGEINAFYSPRDKQVTFCYELLAHLANVFVQDGQWTPEQAEAVDGAFAFITMHEVGHALVDVLDLPITGREEDAVDQLAAVMLLGTGDKGAQAALNGVLAIQPGENAVFDDSDFADEHSLGPQRLYNVLCWIYGSDPGKYEFMVARGMLPEDRAVRCPGEFERLSKAWQRLLDGATGGQ